MEPDDVIDLRIGTILNGRYKIVERIAAGATGVVYKAERLELNRKVAVKFLHALYNQNEQIIGRFEREARAMSKLSHPFCVSVIDFGIEDSPYIVMDFVEGETLRDALDKELFDPSRAIRTAQHILAGVGHAHAQGIVHRDLKPANIQIRQDQGLGETIRIFDFGLAKLLDPKFDSNLSEPERIMGTPTYMSPEQASASEIDDRTDFYSIGIILFEMLTGAPPFRSENHLEVIRMHLEREAPSLAQFCGEAAFSAELEQVVAMALAKYPDQRFSSATEFSEMLSQVPEAASIVPPASFSPSPSPSEREEEEEMVDEPVEADNSDELNKSVEPAEPNRPNTPPRSESVDQKASGSRAGLVKGLLLIGVVVLMSFVALWKLPELKTIAGLKKVETVISSRRVRPLPKIAAKPRGRARVAKRPKTKGETAALKKQAEDYADSGQIDLAIKSYVALRRSDPNHSPYIFRLARLFFRKKWWKDSIAHYEETLRVDKSYAQNTVLIQDVINMLNTSRRLGKRAYKLIREELGAYALPELKKAADQHKSPAVRNKARKLISETLSDSGN